MRYAALLIAGIFVSTLAVAQDASVRYRFDGKIVNWHERNLDFENAQLIMSVSKDRDVLNLNNGLTPDLEPKGHYLEFRQAVGPARDHNGSYVRFIVRDREYTIAQQWEGDGFQLAQSDEPIDVTIPLQRKAYVAELHRIAANEIIRRSSISAEDALAAQHSIFRAMQIELDGKPHKRNYQMLANLLRKSVKHNIAQETQFPYTHSQISDLPGFERLEIKDKWNVYSAFLDALISSPNIDDNIDTLDTFRSAAIGLSDDMVQAVASDPSAYSKLRAVRVFQAKMLLEVRIDDCESAGSTAQQLLTFASEIRASWHAQRQFLLDWGSCLERVSGYGSGLPDDEFLAQVQSSPTIFEQWKSFNAVGKSRVNNYRHSTAKADVRMRELYQLSDRIIN